MTSIVFVDSVAQARSIATNSDYARGWSFLAASPDAVLGCQLFGLKYVKLEDFAAVRSRRDEYAKAVEQFLDWRTWIDRWARERVPEFARSTFNPAECASFILQRIHAEICSSSQSLRELFDAVNPDRVALWRPVIDHVPLHLQPRVNPLLVLAADAARERRIPMDRLTESGAFAIARATCIPSKGHSFERRMRDWAWAHLSQGTLRGVGAAFRSGGVSDSLRALVPMPKPRGRVLACGFGYDLQRLVLELRRSNVIVDQVSAVLTDVMGSQSAVTRRIHDLTADLKRDVRFWRPIEQCCVGRTDLWEATVTRWWTALVPRYWSSYLTASRTLRKRRYDSVLLTHVGMEDAGGPTAQAAQDLGVPVTAYQHGGSADFSGVSLNIYLTAPSQFLVYGDGTVADLRETTPLFVEPKAALIATGSATLDELRAQNRKFGRDRLLRRKLQQKDARPLVLYVPTHFTGYGRAVSDVLRDYPATSYFELVQRMLALWTKTSHVRLVYKDFAVSNELTTVMAGYVQREVPGAIVTSLPIRELMWAVDAIVVDHVITAALEVLLTDKPCVFFMPSTTPQAERARNLLRRGATVATTAAGFVEAVSNLLNCEFRPLVHRDNSFLRAYGLQRDDQRAARRAVAAVEQHVRMRTVATA